MGKKRKCRIFYIRVHIWIYNQINKVNTEKEISGKEFSIFGEQYEIAEKSSEKKWLRTIIVKPNKRK